ncbi:hypothetical protein PENSPDRAFT_679826 [Peniophora sp. CONT]|nr:hypothetical protein PENSPDRAFT_679826 [Peniophora sp. CONT]
MPKWGSTDEVARDTFYLSKTLHICIGVAVWEYSSTFDYEWDVFRGKRRYLWSIWVYSGCRLAMLLCFLLLVVQQNGWLTQHCTAFYIAALGSSYVSLGLASLLIVLRTVAVWERRKSVMFIAYSVWVVSVAFNIRDLTFLRAYFSPDYQSCIAYDTHEFVLNTAGILGSDALLLLLMLIGILRMREARRFGIARFLFRQGVVWLALAMLVEVPVLAFAVLHLNDPLTSILQPIEVVSLSVMS